MEAAFARSFTRMAKIMADARPDSFIAAHPNYDDAVFNIQKMLAIPDITNPFLIGTADIVRYLKVITEWAPHFSQILAADPTVETFGHLMAEPLAA